MYLLDTNVISEARKRTDANPGVRDFFRQVFAGNIRTFISVVTVGEIRRGVELVRLRGDQRQAVRLERWLEGLLDEYEDHVLEIDAPIAQMWGSLRVPQPQNALDKQIAATALIHGLTVVTRNEKGFASTGVPVLNPFTTT